MIKQAHHNVEHTALARKLWYLLTAGERRRFMLLLALILIGVFLETLGLGMVVPAIIVITQDDLGARYPAAQVILDMLGNPSHEVLIVYGLTALVGIFLVKSLYLAALAMYETRFVFNVRVRVSEQLYSTYLSQPWTFHLQRNSSRLIRNILTESNQLIQNALTPMMKLITESLLLIFLLGVLFIAQPLGALAVGLVLGSASLLFYAFVRNHLNRWGKIRQHHEALRIQHLQQGLNGAKDVKLLGREAEFRNSFQIHNRKATRVLRNQAALNQMPKLWLEFLAVLGLAVLVGTMISTGSELGTVLPTLGLFAAVAFRMMPSANRLVSSMNSMRFGAAAVDNLFEQLQLPMEPLPDPARERPIAFSTEVQLDRVAFAYPGTEDPALVDIAMKIREGESIGLIGESGSGKSTLVDLFLGILKPTSGVIRADGVDIHEGLRHWQQHVGYVPQSIYLTDDTLRRNIAFGLADADIDEQAIARAIEAAQLDDFVARLPEGTETVVGEHGVRLSGGQRQRIGIARALYHDPDILVLDEATSALDNATEQEVMKSVAALHGKKTILIVAHRLSTVSDCDRIYRLHDGRIIDEGTSAEVLADADTQVRAARTNGSSSRDAS